MGNALRFATVARVENPSLEVFQQEFVKPGRPVVITGATTTWKALSAWSPDYLKQQVGDVRCKVTVKPAGPREGNQRKISFQVVREEMPFSEYLAAILEPDGEGRRYDLNVSLHQGPFKVLGQDIVPPSYFSGRPLFDQVLFTGPEGYVVPPHYDVPQNLLAQVTGRKRVVLVPPGEWSRLYPFPAYSPACNYSSVDLGAPDLSRFPQVRPERFQEALIEPGDMLFIPSCWWHQVHYLTASLSVNFWYRLQLREISIPAVRCVGMILRQPELRNVLRFLGRRRSPQAAA